MTDLLSALALVAILEGLMLLVMPGGWKRAAAQLQAMPDRQLRTIGGIVVIAGMLSLYVVRVL